VDPVGEATAVAATRVRAFKTVISEKFNVTIYPNGGATQLAMIRASLAAFDNAYPDPLATSVSFL